MGVQLLNALRVNVNGISLTFVTLETIARPTCVNFGMWIQRSLNARHVFANLPGTTQTIHGEHQSADALTYVQQVYEGSADPFATARFQLQALLKIVTASMTMTLLIETQSLGLLKP